MQEMRVRSLDQEYPLEKEMAAHCSILAWRIPWTEEPGGLQSMESEGVRYNLVTKQRQLLHLWSPSPRRREDSQARALPLLKLVPPSTGASGGEHMAQGLEEHTAGVWRGLGGPQEGCLHPASSFPPRRMSQPGARLT